MSLKLGSIALFTLLLVAEQSPNLTCLACWISGERSLPIGLLVFVVVFFYTHEFFKMCLLLDLVLEIPEKTGEYMLQAR